MRTPEEIREHVEAWEGEDEVLRCDLCGAVIETDWYADIKYKNRVYHKVCEECYEQIYEEWQGEHRRVY